MDRSVHPGFLPHEDPEASLAFWRDALGFEVRDDVGYGGMRWITVGPADQLGTSIVLQPPASPGCGVTDEERRTIVEMMAKGTYAAINLATADLDGVFERLKGRRCPGWAGEPSLPPGVRRRSVTATRSRTTRRPAERSSGSRSGALEYVDHRAWAVIERPLGARSQLEGRQRGGGANAEEMTTTRTSQTQSNQRG